MMKFQPSRKPARNVLGRVTALAIGVAVIGLLIIPAIRTRIVAGYSYGAWFVREFTVATAEKVFYPWRQDTASSTDESNDADSAELTVLRGENERLKAMLGRKPATEAIAARVLVKPPQAPFDEIVIDTGASAGVEQGAALFDDQGALVGSVVSVSDSYSQAKLFSSPGLTTEAEMEKSGIVLSLEGAGDGAFSVRVPRTMDVSVGDLFVLPGLKSRPLARVAAVAEEAEDSFKVLHLRGVFAPRSLSWVFVEARRSE